MTQQAQANAQLTSEEKALVEAELTVDTDEVNASEAEAASEAGEATAHGAEDPTSDAASPADAEKAEGETSEKDAKDAKAAPPKEETPEEKAARERQEKTATWKTVEAAKKQHIQNVRLGEQLKTERAKVVEQTQRLQAYEGQLQRQSAQIQEQGRQIHGLTRALAEGDASAVLVTLGRLRGVSPDEAYRQLTRAALEAGTPEGIARKSTNEVERLRRELEQRDQQAAARAQVAATRQEASRLVQLVEEHADEFPELFEWPPERVAAEGIAVRDELLRGGYRVTFDIVLKELSQRAKSEAEQAQARRSKRTQQAANGGARSNGQQSQKAATNGNGQQADRPQAPNAPTNLQAAKKATPPPNLTEEQLDEWCLGELRKLPGGSAKTA